MKKSIDRGVNTPSSEFDPALKNKAVKVDYVKGKEASKKAGFKNGWNM